MQVNRIIVKVAALLGLALALTLGSATIAGAQYDGGYDGGEDCPPGYEGYAGYEGCGEGTDPDPDTAPDESAAPPPSSGGSVGGSGATLPDTGGVAMLGLAGAVAVSGLALRRLIST